VFLDGRLPDRVFVKDVLSVSVCKSAHRMCKDAQRLWKRGRSVQSDWRNWFGWRDWSRSIAAL